MPFAAVAAILDPPHNVSNGYGCDSCHDLYGGQSFLMPPWSPPDPQSIDDTQCNYLCWSCHNESPIPYDYKTHSSLQAGNKYGDWSVQCWVCHNPHNQDQNNFNDSSYGKLVRRTIRLDFITGTVPPKTGMVPVVFKGNTGANSFADDDNVYDGICQVCHTKTNHFRNTGEVNVTGNGYDHTNTVGTDCMNCHSHENGFIHGGGSGIGCYECHGHDPGYDDTVYGVVTGGAGTYQSHSTHTENDEHDIKGPNLACSDCHDTDNFPAFNDGTASLAATTVCDTCHSEGGTYKGLSDLVVGAKNNWRNSIYDHAGGNPSTLQAGKEKWCATCHDETPSQIQGVSAPNVIGDEDAVPLSDQDDPDHYPYGDIEPGWGYYKTGHGLEAGRNFPSKGGVETLSGRPVECDSCHDYATAHIDGKPRSYDDGDVKGLDPAIYRQGYRLKMINGQEPLSIPKTTNTGNTVDHYRVCFQIGCHSFGPAFTDTANMDTSMVTDGVNRHAYHLNFNNDNLFAGDWSGTKNSRMTCTSCHNVHGSTQLAMVRDGKLIGQEPGQEIWYKNDAITYIGTNSTVPPIPDDLPLSASDGKAWNPASSINLCFHCHPENGFTATNDRTPYQDVNQAPILEWTGTSGLTEDGVAPDSGTGNSMFTFRVSYSDLNNDSPSPIEVWVDLDDDDDGTYEVGERFVMNEADTMDTNLVDGKIFTKELTVAKAGDGVLNYRFYASDGVLDASGDPTGDKTVTVTNNSPVLSWTGEDHYEVDGVYPDRGISGSQFTFKVLYRDADGECPDGDGVDVIVNGTTYELTQDDSGSCATGRTYYDSITLNTTGALNYNFSAKDAVGTSATGDPTSNHVVTVLAGTNNPPFLEWVDGTCRTEGVKPAYGAIETDFEFYVKYTDPDGDCPSGAGFLRVTIDGSTYDMGAVDGDSDCSDGKFYSYTTPLNTAGIFNYSFSAQDDGGAGAYGDPTLTSTYEVEVVDALKVRPAGGTGWYSSIQAAIDAVNNAHTVLVYDGTYNEDIEFDRYNDNQTIVRSVCGPDTTIIDGSGTVSTVTLTRNVGSLLDGLQVTGGTRGVIVSGSDTTINNCKIHGNSSGGIYAGQNGSYPTLTLTNSEIYNNTSDRGAGVRIWRGTGHLIDNSIIRNNTTTGDSLADGGGGLHIFQVGEVTISNSTISDNESINYPGGGLYVSQAPDDYSSNGGLTIEDSTIRNNTTTTKGGGVYSDLSKIYFVRSSITGNSADDDGPFPYAGGGAYSQPSASNYASFENCIVADNESKQAGMAYLNGGDLDIINSTIANNRTTLATGGAIYSNPNADPAIINIRNSILWGNQAANYGHIGSFSNGPVTITDSVIQNGDDGNFINAPFFIGSVPPTVSGFTSEDDPWFVGGGNYHIRAFSPAVDNAEEAYAPALDIDGQDRPQGTADDIGADEYRP